MKEKPCPCCGHDDVAVNLAIKDIMEQNNTLRAERADHDIEVRTLQSQLAMSESAEVVTATKLEAMTAERDAAVARVKLMEEALEWRLFLREFRTEPYDLPASERRFSNKPFVKWVDNGRMEWVESRSFAQKKQNDLLNAALAAFTKDSPHDS